MFVLIACAAASGRELHTGRTCAPPELTTLDRSIIRLDACDAHDGAHSRSRLHFVASDSNFSPADGRRLHDLRPRLAGGRRIAAACSPARPLPMRNIKGPRAGEKETRPRPQITAGRARALGGAYATADRARRRRRLSPFYRPTFIERQIGPPNRPPFQVPDLMGGRFLSPRWSSRARGEKTVRVVCVCAPVWPAGRQPAALRRAAQHF